MITKLNSSRLAKSILILGVLVIILNIMALTYDKSGLSKGTIVSAGIQQPAATNGWFLSGSRPDEYKTGLDTINSQHGQKCGFIESTAADPDGFATLMQQCNVKDFKGKRIKMTGFIRTKDADQGGMMWKRVDDFEKKIVADFDNMEDRAITGNKDWTKCEIVFDVPDTKCAISFGFMLAGSGKIWFDNLTFEIVNTSLDKTAYLLNKDLSDEMISKVPEVLPEKAPANLDFED